MAEEDKDATMENAELNELLSTKKKKKKKPLDLATLGKALNDVQDDPSGTSASNTEAGQSILNKGADNNEEAAEGNENDNIDHDIDFNFAKKKKKKKKVIAFDDENDRANDENIGEGQEDGLRSDGDGGKVEGSNWVGTDRDYTYDELIDHVFSIIRANNPELNAGEKKRFVLKPPTVLRVGTKKTSFANFLEICKLVHRQPKHMQAFLLAELGTSGSVDSNNQLIIKGRFQQTQIENVLRRYIKEYVACQTCRSPNTILQKETRLFFLQCEKCGSRRSVSSIKSGFQAVTSKRAAIRAKTN